MTTTSTERVVIYQLLPRLFSNTCTHNKPFGTITENGCGKLNHITTLALQEIRKLGATHIWFTGLLEHATCTDYGAHGIPRDNPLTVKGQAGSPYAIKDYYDIAPDLAQEVPQRMQEFEALVARCHAENLKVIIDFVPNHVARQYGSDALPLGVEDLGESDNPQSAFLPSNNFYYLPDQELNLPAELLHLPYVGQWGTRSYREFPAKATGNDIFHNQPTLNDWYETIKLNYGVDYPNHAQKHFQPTPDTWYKMRDILLFWAGKQVDGFRCDMAEMVPLEFWQWVIPQVKEKYPHVIFIAEIYNPEVYRDFVETGGFDYLYDKVGLYDTLRGILEEKAIARQITHEWQKLKGLDPYMVRFMENHDEQRIASRHFAREARYGLPAMAVAALMNTGPVMIYFGQECGEPALGKTGFSDDDGRTSIFDYCGVPEHIKWVNNGRFDGGMLSDSQRSVRGFYSRLLNLCQHPAIQQGEFYDLMWYNKDHDHFEGRYIYTFVRYLNEKAFLVVANFHKTNPIRLRIHLPDDLLELMGLHSRFSIYGKDALWDQKVFFSDGAELKQNGLVIVSEASSVYAFELEISRE